MKNKLTFLAGIVLLSTLSFGQTAIIAAKSRAGNTDEVTNKEDNFGIVNPAYEYRDVDSVKYFASKKMVVEYRTNPYNNQSYSDTLNYENDNEQAIFEHLRVIRLNFFYPTKTKFIDFPKEIEKLTKAKMDVQQYEISIWFIVLLLFILGRQIEKRHKTA